MKSFKKEIKKRMLWILSFSVLGVLAIVTALAIKINWNGAAGSGLSMELLTGFSAGFVIVTAYRILKYYRALSSREALEALHIRETDERNCTIVLKACNSCINIAFTLLGAAAIIAALFSRAIFLTIGIILITLLILYGSLMLYYSRKY